MSWEVTFQPNVTIFLFKIPLHLSLIQKSKWSIYYPKYQNVTLQYIGHWVPYNTTYNMQTTKDDKLVVYNIKVMEEDRLRVWTG